MHEIGNRYDEVADDADAFSLYVLTFVRKNLFFRVWVSLVENNYFDLI